MQILSFFSLIISQVSMYYSFKTIMRNIDQNRYEPHFRYYLRSFFRNKGRTYLGNMLRSFK